MRGDMDKNQTYKSVFSVCVRGKKSILKLDAQVCQRPPAQAGGFVFSAKAK